MSWAKLTMGEIDKMLYNRRNSEIPVDLFVSKKHEGIAGGGTLLFTDSGGYLVFKVDLRSSSSSNNSTTLRNQTGCTTLLLDAHGNSLLSLHRNRNGPWQVFKEDNCKEDPIFRVERTLNTHSKIEFEIFPSGENREDSECDYRMKGSPFQRSCTIYKGNSIVAQTSLMYKLGLRHNVYVPRRRFRLTIFPGQDHPSIAALIAIFFHGRKFWI